jgi:ribosome-associated protein
MGGVAAKYTVKDMKMQDSETLRTIVNALENKKADAVRVLKIGKITVIADYFVIASGKSPVQVKAMADETEEKLAEKGLKPTRTEGYRGANWIILDYDNIVVHVFHEDTRQFYDLENLWRDGEEVTL